MSITANDLVGYSRAEFAKASRWRLVLLVVQLIAGVPTALSHRDRGAHPLFPRYDRSGDTHNLEPAATFQLAGCKPGAPGDVLDLRQDFGGGVSTMSRAALAARIRDLLKLAVVGTFSVS